MNDELYLKTSVSEHMTIPVNNVLLGDTMPVPDWHGIGQNEHAVQFYESHNFLVDSLSDFVYNCLRDSDACIVVATGAHREALKDRLEQRGIDLHAAIASGDYVPLDAAETLSKFLIEGSIVSSCFVEFIGELISRVSQGRSRVRIFGEMVALLWADRKFELALQLEGLWNELRKSHSFSLFCAYPINGFDGSEIAPALTDICLAHTHIVPAESYTTLENDGERLRNVIQLQRKAMLLEAEIFERKQIEAKLRVALVQEQNARAEAENANRIKDEFLANVSHELRTPLTAIIGWAYMLRKNTLNEATLARALETIERNAKSQAQLIEDILDVSRVIAGKLRLRVGPVDMETVVTNAIDSIQLAADAKAIRLELVLSPSARQVIGDASRLQQIVWNLLSNAIKFTPPGGQVEVRLDRAGSNAHLSVIDNGEGIPKSFLPFVFDRFRQADGASTRTRGGLGLGLAIVRHLVELHGGTVEATSEGEGCGSIFRISLPLALDDGRSRIRVTNTGSLGLVENDHNDVQSLPSLAGLQVLVVDDDHDTLEMVTTMLKGASAIVQTASSVAEALELLQSYKPDVLVSDLAMPGQDGYSLIGKIRELEANGAKQLHAVALTAFVRVEDRARALSAGFNMFVPKPVTPSELISAILALT